MAETTMITARTGGQKGRKIERFDLIPPGPLKKLAQAYGSGALKYADRNWERGYDWSLSFGALQRHVWAFWHGEDNDPESKLPHLAHVAWHALALMEFMEKHRDLDDRPKERQVEK